jgi:orotate phosphoribosyltransferase
MSLSDPRSRLLALLKQKSVFYGDFVLASGGRSTFYIDCKLTTLDPAGALLAGEVMEGLIRRLAAEQGKTINAVGGLTMGADPLALAIGMRSVRSPGAPIQVFTVRKSPKSHGQLKLIEGNFRPGDHVVVIDDVVTKAESTFKAIEAVENAGGRVELVIALVDREEGGSQRIKDRGYPFIAVFRREEVLARETGAAGTEAARAANELLPSAGG